MRKLFLAWLLVSMITTGCSKAENKQSNSPDSLILQVNQGPYAMTMYPRYETEKESKLYLDVRRDGKTVDGAQVAAHLIAKDGDKAMAEFIQDAKLRVYVAHVPLKHQEDYVIETEVRLKDKEKTVLRPTFAFHCGDPIPHVMDENVDLEESAKNKK